MLKKILMTSFILGSLLLVENQINPVYASELCSYDDAEFDKLKATIDSVDYSSGKAVATVTNNSQECAFTVGMSSYAVPEGGDAMAGLNKQVRVDYTNSSKLDSGESMTLTVDLPDNCRAQLDVYVGSSIATFNYPNGKSGVDWYSPRLIEYYHTDKPYCFDDPEEPEEPEDVCTNLDGVQEETPEGFVNENGVCTKPEEPKDVCTNLEGVQEETPEGYVNENGVCTKPEDPEEPEKPEEPKDVCTNIDGIQKRVPAGYKLEGTACVKEEKIRNESIELTKKVRFEGQGDDFWKDKVMDVKAGDIIEFRIKVKNTGNTKLNSLKITDELPDELERVGGSGLTEYLEDFEAGEKKTFIIRAKVKDEYLNEESCVVNEAYVEHGDSKKSEDYATVCYGEVELTELPETGPAATLALSLLGLSSLVLGIRIKRSLQ